MEHARSGLDKGKPDAETQRRQMFLVERPEAGFYMALCGMMALSLPFGPKELGRIVAAFRKFLTSRAPLLRDAAS